MDLGGQRIIKVVQSDFHNVFLNLLSPHRNMWLRVYCHPQHLCFYPCSPHSQKKSVLRFEQFLHAHIVNRRITESIQINTDRIVKLKLQGTNNSLFLYLRLWSGKENILITDENNLILEALFRRPRQGVVKGKYFEPPPASEPSDCTIRSNERPFSTYLHTLITQEEKYRGIQEEKQKTDSFIEDYQKHLDAKIGGVELSLKKNNEAQNLQHYGHLLLTHDQEAKQGSEDLSVFDYEKEKIISIPIDPQFSRIQNAQQYFEKARIRQRRIDMLDEEKRILGEKRTLFIQAVELYRESGDESLLKGFVPTQRKEEKKKKTVGLSFESKGHLILVGRNSRENDYILRHLTRGNDYWFHARDYPGSHVFVKRKEKKKALPSQITIDAANLALHFSKGRREEHTDILICQVKNLRRAKHGLLGMVIPLREKVLHLRKDSQRLSYFLTGT